MSTVSVIVPVYNVENYVKKCVESIVNQTYADLEIILVDDGSTDNSGLICDELRETDRRIRVFHTENKGLSCARNYGLEHANGEYISFIDSDDYVYDTFIENLYKMCLTYNSDISQCDFLYVKEDSKMLYPQEHAKIEVISGKDAILRCCKQPNAVKYNVAWNKLYHRRLFEKIRYPEGRIHEDEFTSYKLFFESKNVAITNKYLHCYLQRKGSITGAEFNLKKLDRIDAYRERLYFLKKNNLSEAYDAFIASFYQTLCGTVKIVLEQQAGDENVINCLVETKRILEKEIWKNPNKSFNEKLRLIYPNLSDDEREIYKQLHVSDNLYSKSESYICPFGIIPKGSNIVIYGAGKVGQEYYRQIVNCDYANIIDWVDNGWKAKKIKGVEIHPVNNLISCEFDYVLIGIKEIDMALEIKENLMAWGIDEKKILWKSPLCISINDAGGIAVNKTVWNDVKKHSNHKKVILFNTPEHGNLGDHALAMAATSFLKRHFLDYEYMEVSGKQWDYLEEEISNLVGDEDVLFIVGGGYMGSVWPKEDYRVKNIIKRFPMNKVFFLPQTFFYEEDNNQDKKLWNDLLNVYFVHRESNSYEYFTDKIVSDVDRNALFPDMVLSIEYDGLDSKRSGIGLCFRADKERTVPKNKLEKLRAELEKNGISCTETDTVLKDNISIQKREEAVLCKLNEFSKYELLITDRLHGMIFAAITHTPCLALNNMTGKVFGVYKWIQSCPYIQIVDNDVLDYELVSASYKKKWDTDYRFDLSHLFEEMADWIKDKI